VVDVNNANARIIVIGMLDTQRHDILTNDCHIGTPNLIGSCR
jgi:hypothetical protein